MSTDFSTKIKLTADIMVYIFRISQKLNAVLITAFALCFSVSPRFKSTVWQIFREEMENNDGADEVAMVLNDDEENDSPL